MNKTKEARYLQCKAIAQKINKYLALGNVVVDEYGEIFRKRSEFIFDDSTHYIAIKSGNLYAPYCGDEGWGAPKVSIFKQIKVCKEFIKL
jgi:hypothetical protein